ncbi:RidA family protein [Rhodobacteraceae bacterium RKSG542]|uniref:RidA family protein n=1 Tax=Pseudovibrio flavus TaxID=2529854 RepID=UPI0012BC3E46|nr:RidA family protein [Pseudovibrio flavus]MTI17749.1 RidA family protein [Pseudovibrio flavus]
MTREVKGIIPGLPIATTVREGDTVYLCGHLAYDDNDAVVGTDIVTQCEQTMKNLVATLEECGSDISLVNAVTIHLVNRSDFAGMNAVYGKYFGEFPPVRTTVIAGLIDERCLIEITAIASIKK